MISAAEIHLKGDKTDFQAVAKSKLGDSTENVMIKGLLSELVCVALL